MASDNSNTWSDNIKIQADLSISLQDTAANASDAIGLEMAKFLAMADSDGETWTDILSGSVEYTFDAFDAEGSNYFDDTDSELGLLIPPGDNIMDSQHYITL